jgi:hypothetical protein
MRQRDLGTGLNTVDRQYAKTPREAWDAAVAAVKAMELQVESDRHDALGGELVARRADGHRVNVIVKAMDRNSSQVSVRVEPGNRNMAEMIHEWMADKLGLGEAKGALLGGNSVEGTYTQSVATCAAAAEQACRKLSYIVTHREVRDASARIDARQPDSTPVRFQAEKSGDRTKVTFIAGRSGGEAAKAAAQKMKDEFERQLPQLGN